MTDLVKCALAGAVLTVAVAFGTAFAEEPAGERWSAERAEAWAKKKIPPIAESPSEMPIGTPKIIKTAKLPSNHTIMFSSRPYPHLSALPQDEGEQLTGYCTETQKQESS